MKLTFASFLHFFTGLLLFSCDSQRTFEDNMEFADRRWKVTDSARFEFDIPDTVQTYSLFCNLRNTIDYPYSRIFVLYALQDSSRQELSGKLLRGDLFDKTGRPLGESGLGDIYDHRFPLIEHHRFKHPGKYSVSFSQFMRQDTLKGILAVGLRVENDLP